MPRSITRPKKESLVSSHWRTPPLVIPLERGAGWLLFLPSWSLLPPPPPWHCVTPSPFSSLLLHFIFFLLLLPPPFPSISLFSLLLPPPHHIFCSIPPLFMQSPPPSPFFPLLSPSTHFYIPVLFFILPFLPFLQLLAITPPSLPTATPWGSATKVLWGEVPRKSGGSGCRASYWRVNQVLLKKAQGPQVFHGCWRKYI